MGSRAVDDIFCRHFKLIECYFLLVAILATVTNLGGNPGAGGTGLCRLEELHFILLIELIYSKLCVNRLRISA